jgi:hypothetical protein
VVARAAALDSLEVVTQGEASMRDLNRRVEAFERWELRGRAEIAQDAVEGRLWMWSIFRSLRPAARAVAEPPAVPSLVAAQSGTSRTITPPRLSSGAPTEDSDQLVPQRSGDNNPEPHSASDLLVTNGNHASLSGSLLIQMGASAPPLHDAPAPVLPTPLPSTDHVEMAERHARLEIEEASGRFQLESVALTLSMLTFTVRDGGVVCLDVSFGRTLQRLERPLLEDPRNGGDGSLPLPVPEPVRIQPRKPDASTSSPSGRAPRKPSSASKHAGPSVTSVPEALATEEMARQALLDEWASKWRRIVRTARAHAV